MKWAVRINRVEYYEMDVVVEAETADEAIKMTEAEWEKDTYLFDHLSNCMTDSETRFWKRGAASESEIKTLITLYHED